MARRLAAGLVCRALVKAVSAEVTKTTMQRLVTYMAHTSSDELEGICVGTLAATRGLQLTESGLQLTESGLQLTESGGSTSPPQSTPPSVATSSEYAASDLPPIDLTHSRHEAGLRAEKIQRDWIEREFIDASRQHKYLSRTPDQRLTPLERMQLRFRSVRRRLFPSSPRHKGMSVDGRVACPPVPLSPPGRSRRRPPTPANEKALSRARQAQHQLGV